MNAENSEKDLMLLIQSRTPLVVIDSQEEKRVIDMIGRIARKLKRPAFTWSITEGLKNEYNEAMVEWRPEKTLKAEMVLKTIKTHRNPSIYVLCDFHPHLKNAPENVRHIKELAMDYDCLEHTLIFLSHEVELPHELKPFSARFEMPMPDAAMLKSILREEIEKWSQATGRTVRSTQATLEKLVRNLLGLTIADARRLIRKAICDDGVLSESDLPEINKAKYELLDMDGVLSFELETARFNEIGGLKNLKAWLKQREAAFCECRLKSNPDQPKGLMLLGVQGGGKSLAAKAVAGAWGLPLLRLDFAVLYNKFFGETERNLRKALKMADLMAPCVLWIDEIEKGLATGDYDSGTSRRVLGTFLTWMSERKKPVFIVATSNDISALPPELVRKGRLDEIFFVDLPEASSRLEILQIHMAKRGLKPAAFDLQALVQETAGFSGAEIEQAVAAGLYGAKGQNQVPATEHLLAEIRRTRPLSVVMAEQVQTLRDWAANRTVQAN
jgi:SpoVK/Ycf46/Vps4 family AAA+-type ATPase